MIGDFNCIRNESERKNCEYCRNDSKGFEYFITDNNLFDLELNNSLFTWFGPNGKCSKLDRFLVNDKWMEVGSWQASSLCRQLSDHKPIFLNLVSDSWGPKPFKAFNWWLQDPEVNKLLLEFLARPQDFW